MLEGPPVFVSMDEIVAQRHLILSTLLHRKIPPQELPDLVQTVYLGALRAMRAGRFRQGSFPLEEALTRWLVGISWRTAARYHESAQRREIPSSDVEIEIEGPDPEAQIEAREALRELSALPEKHRAALVGVALGDRSIEIAASMGVSHTSVAVRLCEGRRELARRLAT